MPNRILKESIKKSPQIDQLTWFEEVVFYRLIVSADDYGRFDGRPIVLKNELFPTKDSITKKNIDDAISKLASLGLVHRYIANGVPLLCLPTWGLHQRVRDSKERYPGPEDGSPQSAATCGESPQISAVIQSNPNPNPNPNPNSYRRFTPPTVQDVQSYCAERGNHVDAQRFVDFYESKGWRIGKEPMKDWRAAVRTWEKRDSSSPKNTNPFLRDDL